MEDWKISLPLAMAEFVTFEQLQNPSTKLFEKLDTDTMASTSCGKGQ